MKKRAILITGFSNWGKSKIIYTLFGRKRIGKQTPYKIKYSNLEREFIVMPYSNDDINQKRFLKALKERYNDFINSNVDLLSAFCPSSEEKNNSLEILKSDFFSNFDEIILIYLVDRWDNHASLNIEIINNFYKGLKNLKKIEIIIDNSKSVNARLNDKIKIIKDKFENIYKQKE